MKRRKMGWIGSRNPNKPTTRENYLHGVGPRFECHFAVGGLFKPTVPAASFGRGEGPLADFNTVYLYKGFFPGQFSLECVDHAFRVGQSPGS
ncbi:hypothetical protein AKJ63_01640 [candidate division MSBL1 archaeon SCGC-AAA259D18]|uniref:Uncharacterized protein n=1 Tax=candidate division MSBL1 archaeon SCGC-AAA259D18 TaxID=1698262 RepID=A0A133UAV4_9EURY|nr:hypothetical protein AKJ63_01640 [candidate division MSBL1 archaeon SCGC-AAA259D18]